MMRSKKILQSIKIVTAVVFISVIGGCATSPSRSTEADDKSRSQGGFGIKAVKATAVRVMSWNVKHLGRANLDYASAVKVLKNGDVVALQEVNKSNGKEALEKFGKLLENALGEKTCEGITESTEGPGSERYAFLWINSKVSLVRENGKTVSDCPEDAVQIELNKKHANRIDREPGQATFEVKGAQSRFTVASVHLVPTAKKPANEVPWLFDSVNSVSGVVIVVGDFNLGSSHQAFKKARDLKFVPALDAAPTSLKMNTRSLNQPYDNLWIRGAEVSDPKVIDLYKEFPKIKQKEIYNNISDHSPVSAVIEM